MGRKDKWRYSGDEDRDGDYAKVQKVRQRRLAKKAEEARDPFEKEESEWDLNAHEGSFRARIVEVHKRYCFVSPEPHEGDIATRDPWLATVARRFLTTKRAERNFVCVGDVVWCRPTNEKDALIDTDIPCCVIMHMAPRKNRIARVDPATPEREHVLASNIDQLLIVASFLAPKVRWGLIDRYLVLAEEQGVPAKIILNKEDLLKKDGEPEFVQEATERVALYRKLGYEVITLSALGLKKATVVYQELKWMLSQKITLLSGHSGVGKSSIVNLFRPEIVQEVEPNPDIFYKGRHTTTYASMIKLGHGGYVVDTPGIRSFIVPPRDPIQLTAAFVDMKPYLGKCKFRECRHVDEPDCAVLAAVERGDIHAWRYRSYLGLLLGESGREGRVRDEFEHEEALLIDPETYDPN